MKSKLDLYSRLKNRQRRIYKIKYLMLTACISISNVKCVFADNSNRMDMKLLEGILIFLQSCSYFFFAIGIGMFIYSIKDQDGSKKVDSIKIIGVGLLLYVLKHIARVGGLI